MDGAKREKLVHSAKVEAFLDEKSNEVVVAILLEYLMGNDTVYVLEKRHGPLISNIIKRLLVTPDLTLSDLKDERDNSV